MARRLPYREGDCFAVPIPGGGFAVGVAARLGRRGGVLGYFFLSPSPGNLTALRPERADLVAMFGDPHLLDGTWPVLGQVPSWNRDEWPVPRFVRQDVISSAWRVSEYDDKLSFVSEWLVTPREAKKYPQDGALGCDAVTDVLDDLIAKRHVTPYKQLPKLGPAILAPATVPATSKKTTKRKIAAKTATP